MWVQMQSLLRRCINSQLYRNGNAINLFVYKLYSATRKLLKPIQYSDAVLTVYLCEDHIVVYVPLRLLIVF